MKRIKFTTFIIALIILAGLLLRLYKFEEFFYYAIDEEKAAFITSQIADFTHFPTVSFPSSIGFRLGAVFFYLTASLYKIFYPHPLTIGYLSVVFSVFSMIMLYKIVKKMNAVSALIALFLFAFSFLNLIYERRGWQLSFETPLLLLIIYFLLHFKKNIFKNWLLFSAVLALLWQLEVGLLTFGPLLVIFFIFYRIKINRAQILKLLAVFFFFNVSLLVFDLRHQFLNSRYLLNYFRPQAVERNAAILPLTDERSVYLAHNLIPNTLSRLIYPGREKDLAIQYANCPQYLALKQSQVPPVFKLLSIIVLLFGLYRLFTLKNRQTDEFALILLSVAYLVIHSLLIALYTYFFRGEMAEYYLIPVFVFFFILLADFLVFLGKKTHPMTVFFLLSLYAYYNIPLLLKGHNSYGYLNKQSAIKYTLDKVGNSSFEIDSFQTCWYSGGFRYPYTLTGREPVRSYMDRYLIEYYQSKPGQPDYKVTFITPELVGTQPEGFGEFRRKTAASSFEYKKFGAIEVYLEKLNL